MERKESVVCMRFWFVQSRVDAFTGQSKCFDSESPVVVSAVERNLQQLQSGLDGKTQFLEYVSWLFGYMDMEY